MTIARTVIAFGVLALVFPSAAVAGPMTISATTNQSGHLNFTGASTPLTGNPYDFSSQGYASLASIDNISVTLTLDDGDTAPGDFDFGNLTLALDGIDTGLRLDGFTDDANDPNQPVTLTFSGTPNNAAAILAALQADGQLIGTILDATPGDNIVGVPKRFNTTLDITGQQVPEPATLVLFGLGAVGIAAYSLRKRGRSPA